MGPHDITGRIVAPERLSEHLIRFRTHDWASTDLGPMSSWPHELRRMVNLCMADPRGVAVWWGPKRIILYNDNYRRTVLGERDAWALGKPAVEVWHDQAQDGQFLSSFGFADATGLPSFGDDTCFFVEHNGQTHEFWASWAVIPLPGASNNIGYYNSCTVTTRQVIYERRMSMLLDLERRTGTLTDRQDFFKQIIASLAPNRLDAPFAALYSINAASGMPSMERSSSGSEHSSEHDASSVTSSADMPLQWTLEGILESTPDILNLPHKITMDSASEIFGPLLKACIATKTAQILKAEDHTLPIQLQKRALSRGYGDRCIAAQLVPICQGHRKTPVAFLLLGVNSRVAYDADYERFTSLLARQLAISMGSVAMAEDEARHARMSAELAARDRMQLTEKLNFSEHDAKLKEIRFRTMAEQAPVSFSQPQGTLTSSQCTNPVCRQVAMFELSPAGELNYANETWYRMSGHPHDDLAPFSWLNTIHPDGREPVLENWGKLVAGEPSNFEMRLSKAFVSQT